MRLLNLNKLWLGNYPLNEAFWTWAVTIGLFVNVTTSLLFLMLITLELPWLALMVGYGLSVPYNIVAAMGVWRSAARYGGPAIHADLARASSILLLLALSLT